MPWPTTEPGVLAARHPTTPGPTTCWALQGSGSAECRPWPAVSSTRTRQHPQQQHHKHQLQHTQAACKRQGTQKRACMHHHLDATLRFLHASCTQFSSTDVAEQAASVSKQAGRAGHAPTGPGTAMLAPGGWPASMSTITGQYTLSPPGATDSGILLGCRCLARPAACWLSPRSINSNTLALGVFPGGPARRCCPRRRRAASRPRPPPNPAQPPTVEDPRRA